MDSDTPPPLAVTMGEPAGVGGEIVLKAWRSLAASGPYFALLGDPAWLSKLASDMDVDFRVQPIDSIDDTDAVFADALPVLPVALATDVATGRPDPANVPAIVAAIDRAVDLVLAGDAAALVTSPIHKAVMYEGGFEFPGHTEYLSIKGGCPGQDAMMLAIEGLRVVPVTIHLPMADVSAALSRDLIAGKARLTAKTLSEDFGIAAPRLAVAALNPHAGESGALGREEIEIIAPAIGSLRSEGIDVTGPRPADTLFHEAARSGYDAVLCMYPDQALIPLKTLDFDGGVNITMGLPFIRTSPDHGTALDIAGTGKATPTSMIAAIRMADRMARNRRQE